MPSRHPERIGVSFDQDASAKNYTAAHHDYGDRRRHVDVGSAEFYATSPLQNKNCLQEISGVDSEMFGEDAEMRFGEFAAAGEEEGAKAAVSQEAAE